MKITAFYPGLYPNGHAPMSHRLHYYMKALQCKNVEVNIVVPSEGKRTGGVFDGIPYSYVLVTKQNRFNRYKVLLEFAEICGELARECDVLFTTCWGNNHLNKTADSVHKNRGKLVIEINENPYVIFSSRLNTRIGLYFKRQYFLWRSIKKADGIIVISQALLDLINKHKSPHALLIKIPILSDKIKRPNILSTSASLYEAIPYIIHAGAISEQKDGVKAMLEAFKIAHKHLNGNLKFIFTYNKGFPYLLKWIRKFLKKNHLENSVEFRGIVSVKELDELYSNCTLAIINKPWNSQNQFNFPTKLTELLPREIPLIISKTGEMANFFLDGVNALMVEPNNAEQIAEKIITIISSPTYSKKIAINGRILAEEKFYYLNYCEMLFDFYSEINRS